MSPFESKVTSYVAENDFGNKSAGGCSTYDVIAPCPDLTRSKKSKVAQKIPRSLADPVGRFGERGAWSELNNLTNPKSVFLLGFRPLYFENTHK